MSFDLNFIGVLIGAIMASSVPLILAASGELITERSGVLNLGVEGMMIIGAISGFAFKGLAGGIAALYLILFTLSFWNIYSYNNKLKDYSQVQLVHQQKQLELKKVTKEFKIIEKTLQLSNTL